MSSTWYFLFYLPFFVIINIILVDFIKESIMDSLYERNENEEEKEKMLTGQLYDSNVDLLERERNKAKELCNEYNSIKPSSKIERKNKLKQILGKIGENITVEPNFYCDYGYNIEVGENFYSNHNLVILDPAKVIIGDNVFVGPNCGFYTASHPMDATTRNRGLEYAKPITIGNNVWIGGGVTILPGVTIGDGAVIGAGSVVVASIPANVLAVGNPCKPIRKIDEKKEG
jgi:acetyltransferase-like isoleucine patch superfamily enzyme